jgi:hypothetical protein
MLCPTLYKLFEILVQHRISIDGILGGFAPKLPGGLDKAAFANRKNRSFAYLQALWHRFSLCLTLSP